jgi:hypothetical protein
LRVFKAALWCVSLDSDLDTSSDRIVSSLAALLYHPLAPLTMTIPSSYTCWMSLSLLYTQSLELLKPQSSTSKDSNEPMTY